MAGKDVFLLFSHGRTGYFNIRGQNSRGKKGYE
jgi:hypothetical protein